MIYTIKSMDYNFHYNKLIETRKKRIIQNDVYYEKHHIIPRSTGGSDDPNNIVILTAREHFIAHWLLYRMYSNNESITYAFWMMSCRFKNFSSIAYEEAKKNFSENVKRRKHSQETKDKISQKRKATGNHWKGKHHSEEGKANISFGRKNDNRTVNPLTEKSRCEKISESHTGKTKTDSHKENIRLAKIGNKNPQYGKPQKRKICEKCGYNTTINNWSKHKC